MITIYYAVSVLQSEACKLTESTGKDQEILPWGAEDSITEWPGWQKE